MDLITKVKRAYDLLITEKEDQFLSIRASNKSGKIFVDIPYLCYIHDDTLPVVCVMDFQNCTLTGWYVWEEFEAFVKKYKLVEVA